MGEGGEGVVLDQEHKSTRAAPYARTGGLASGLVTSVICCSSIIFLFGKGCGKGGSLERSWGRLHRICVRVRFWSASAGDWFCCIGSANAYLLLLLGKGVSDPDDSVPPVVVVHSTSQQQHCIPREPTDRHGHPGTTHRHHSAVTVTVTIMVTMGIYLLGLGGGLGPTGVARQPRCSLRVRQTGPQALRLPGPQERRRW